MPKITIVIPVFNRQSFLARALDSLLKQTYQNWKAIIVDDGSTDHSINIEEEYSIKDPRIKYFKISHQGPSLAKNFGIKKTQTDWITFLDSDDEYLPKHLHSRISLINQNPEIDLFYGGVKVIGQKTVPDRNNPQKKSISMMLS